MKEYISMIEERKKKNKQIFVGKRERERKKEREREREREREGEKRWIKKMRRIDKNQSCGRKEKKRRVNVRCDEMKGRDEW